MEKKNAPLRIGFIGAGRLACTLARAWANAGEIVVGASSRRAESVSALVARCPDARPFHSAAELVDQCDLVFVTVTDTAIEEVSNAVAWHKGQSVVHCSAACEVDLLHHAKQCGAEIGGFHPLQIFSDPEVAIRHLAGSSVAIEASGSLQAQLFRLASAIGMTPLTLREGARLSYHLAGNFSASGLLALLLEAEDLWEDCGFERGTALPALLPLSLGTLNSAAQLGLAKAVSGPVSRGDSEMLRRHLTLAASRETGDQLYRELLVRLIQLANSSLRLTPDQVTELRAALNGAARRIIP